MSQNHISMGRIFGIPLRLHFSWFLIFALLTWSLATQEFPANFGGWPPVLYWVTGALTAGMLYVSVLLHELGHSIVAMRFGVPVNRITLFLFGGVAEIGREPPSAWIELLIAVAGPATSILLAFTFAILASLSASAGPLLAMAQYLAYINFALVLFNLLPGFPLDGGRVFRAILWKLTGDMPKATRIAVASGRFFAFLLIFLGIWRMLSGDPGGLWLMMIGWFLDNAATAQLVGLRVEEVLSRYRVWQATSPDCATIPADLSLDAFMASHLLDGGRRYAVVMDHGTPVGLMTFAQLKHVPRRHWPTTNIRDAMLPIGKVSSIAPNDPLTTAIRKMDRDGVNQLPVMSEGSIVGMLTREDVISFLGQIDLRPG